MPIVSVSIGDTARFVVGGLSRKEPTRPLLLHSGDVIVMGGPSRLRFHGVTQDPARHRAGRHRSGTVQPDVQASISISPGASPSSSPF